MRLYDKGTDYRNVLKDILSERANRNPRYSLRAFSRDLGINSARLSEVLNRKDAFSRKTAEKIAVRLGFTKQEQDLFCTMVESENKRSTRLRTQALERLQKMNVSEDKRLKLDTFEVIADWHHFAILELSVLSYFRSEPAWIARKLSIQEIQAKTAIERMLRLGLLKREENALVATDSQTYAQAGIPSTAVRKYHKQVLHKAIDAIDVQNLDEREFVSVTLAVDSAKIAEAKARINQFQREFCREIDGGKKDELYVFSIQFFRGGEAGHV